ncbi:DHS-like NAD/FAD-binding domain-containing protein [Podospora fimiseda]|uniref:DHS-like NAD/FAD-binding domain-containing protein n=1 Tax=Podospora fimiseda TaxID=252190 RepID=A0AAN7BEP2_9PEZI|nr:DHS-like NAD/FAD-binding domain-containing protein [Podospora fimiseda]
MRPPGPLLRIPYTNPLPSPTIHPPFASTLPGAVSALSSFLLDPASSLNPKTVILTGAGLSVASGLADYRGTNGTYRVNKTYRPIYYHEFTASHAARKRYWARSFLGWSNLSKAQPNSSHYAIRDLAKLGLISSVITQNVDSFHPKAHPEVKTLELHGYLRAATCLSCGGEYDRNEFQKELARLNPRWDSFLQKVLMTGALETEDPVEKQRRGVIMNPDGDVEVPDAPYTTFRYPACPSCLAKPPDAVGTDGKKGIVEVDADGAWGGNSNAGILKPAVVLFGESIAERVKEAAEDAVDEAGRMLVLATSMATYSAWRLVKRAKDRGMPVAVVNMGGVRGDDVFFKDLEPEQDGSQGVRTEVPTQSLLPALVQELQRSQSRVFGSPAEIAKFEQGNRAIFKDMLS